MKTLLTALITFSLITPLFARILPLQESIEALSEPSSLGTSDSQNPLDTVLQLLSPTIPVPTETPHTQKPTETVVQELISQELVSQELVSIVSTQAIITATAQASTSIITAEKPTQSASMASQTLTAIFNFLALLLHSTHSQTNTTPSFSSFLEDVFTLIAQTSGKKGQELALFMNDIKIDCNNTLTRTFENLSATPDLNDYKRPSKDAEKEAKTQAALCNVATIVTGVANIVQNPHDKINVGQSVGSILAGIINIALLASHKPRQLVLNDLIEALNVTA